MTGDDEYASLGAHDGRSVLAFARLVGEPPAGVWRALTEPDLLAGWFPTTIEGERAGGAALTYRFAHVELPPMHGVMLALREPELLELEWGGDILRFDLASRAGGTLLALRVTFDELGKAARDAAGWHQSLDALAATLAGTAGDRGDAGRWRELNAAYAARFGPAAAAIGAPPEWEERHGAG
jgi:uncharacterized protein YndB with AHSA1/START domain